MVTKKLEAESPELREVIEEIKRTRKRSGQWVDLSSRGLSELPQQLETLTDLVNVDVSGNNITTLPEWLFRLPKLQSICAIGNPLESDALSEVPPSVRVMVDTPAALRCSGQSQPGVLHLVVARDEAELLLPLLNAPPAWILSLERLHLGRWGVRIGQRRPPISAAMQSLIDSLPVFGHLVHLGFSELPLARLPDGMRHIKSLRHLSIGGAPKLRVPDWASSLPLTNLALVDCGLTGLPESFGELSSLEALSLDWCGFTQFPSQVLSLLELRYLSLYKNGLTSIPGDLLKLPKLEELNVFGNRLQTPPQEVCDQGLGAIRNFWRQRQQAGVDYLCEAKLIIVGEGGAGKSTLAQKIVDPAFVLDPSQPSTEGIDILRWQFPTAIRPREEGRAGELLQRDFQVNIWDFGGQEIYHATHQFFLTRRSVYLLVCDDRKEDTSFPYWLQVVEMLSNGSPLIIVQNEKLDRTRDINLPALRARFGNLRQALATNLLTNRGLEQVVAAVRHELQALPHVGQALPATWKRVREALEQDSRDFITLAQYLEICRQQGFERRDDMLQLSGYLHDLGICLHFQDDPTLKNTVVLKPAWGTSAVYRVLDDPAVIRARGRFTRADLARIWSEPRYCDMHDELLRLMMKFQLCYALDEGRVWMAPQLLSTAQPAYPWDLRRGGAVELRYVYGFMPKGLITRFIVAMNHLIGNPPLMWRSGVVIERAGTRAEVMEHSEEGDARPFIRVRLSGSDARSLLAIVDDQLERLHASFPRLQYDRELPCPCAECRESAHPRRFALKDLEAAARKGRPIQCYQSHDLVDAAALVRDVLPGLFSQPSGGLFGGERPAADEASNCKREVFVSYADDPAARKLVQQLRGAVADRGIKLLDYQKDIAYRQSIGEFMRRLGRSGCVVMLISRKYLRSEYCMFELLEIAKTPGWHERVFPIVLPDAKLYEAPGRVGHVKFWEKEEAKLDAELKTVKGRKVKALQETLNLYAEVRDLFDTLSDTLADMNAMSPAALAGDGFKPLIEALLERLETSSSTG